MISIILLNLIFSIISVLPNWDLKKSSRELLTSNSYTYTVTHREMYNLEAKLEKTITRSESGTIRHSNTLCIGQTDCSTVNFEYIESFYKLDETRKLLCPKGKFDPINLNGRNQITNNLFNRNNHNWDLKCYNHNTGYFLAFYFNNGEDQVFQLAYQDYYIYHEHFRLHRVLYDFKLINKENGVDQDGYAMCALISWHEHINFLATEYKFKDGKTSRSEDKSKELISIKNYTQAYFSNYSNHFYYFTYNTVSDFSTGYSTRTFDGNIYYSVDPIEVQNNYTTPFEFLNEVEIKELNFLLYTNYAYYSIYDKVTGKTYHGILDVKLNKVVFNTDENIKEFIPYSNYSMLAITEESAFEVCIIKDSNGNCKSQCSTGKIIEDVNGNKCDESCGTDEYLIVPEGVCTSECDTSIYIIKDSYCGLCRDLETTKKYKLINGTECLEDIPEGAETYYPNLLLLECKSGYILNGSICSPHCYESCLKCSEYSINEADQKCLECKEGYYSENENTPYNCLKKIPTTIPTTITTTIPPKIPTTIPTTITTTIPPKIPTTIITTIPRTIPSDCSEENKEKCLKCNEESNRLGLCVSCKDGYKKVNHTIVYAKYLDCIKENDPKYRNYYYNSTLEEYRPCYKTCKRCLKSGDAEKQNCLECETNYMFRPGHNPYNNCVAYSEFYYINPYNQFKSLDIYQCPEEAKYYIKEKRSCIDDCKKDSKYKYLYNGNCLENCPSGTNDDNHDYICMADNTKCILGKNEIYLAENDNLKIIDTLVKTYISEFGYTNHYVSLHQNKNYSIVIYKDSGCIKELSLEMPDVDFQSCYSKVQHEYNITENLIIVIVDRKILNNPVTYYSFYHPKSGLKLNAETICRDETIVVVENLRNVLDKNDSFYDTQNSLTSQGINIFDINHPFYTDICYDFDNPLKKDIPLNDRIKDIFPNASLCDEGCQYKGIDLADMTATCDCKFNDIANNNLIKDNEILESAFGEVFELINSSNILVFKCIKNMFTHFSRSFGGWISVVLIAGHIAMALSFFLFSSVQVNKYIYTLSTNYLSVLKNLAKKNKHYPPKKAIKNTKYEKKDDILISTLNSNNNMINRKIKLTPIKIPNSVKGDGVSPFERKVKIKNTDNIIIEASENIKMPIQTGIIDGQKYDEKFFEEYMSTPLDDMEFDDAVAKDHRKYCEHMRENLIEDQIIANTFIADDPLKPRTIKIILLILNIMLYFVINGLFFSEEVISELYNVDEEEENFFSFFERSIERIIYSLIVGIVIGFITSFFFIDEKKIKGIFRRDRDNINELKKNIFSLMKELKRRYITFIIFVSIILIISTFYLLCFNYVYPYSQIEWIKSSIAIVIIMQVLSTLKCILETSLRFLSYKLKNEKLYKISLILD